MQPTILVSRDDKRVVLSVSGELDLASRDLLCSRCDEVAAADVHPGLALVVDLTNVAFIDCGSIGIVERLIQACVAAGGNAQVVAPEGPVRRVLDLSGFTEAHELRRRNGRAVSWRDRAQPSVRRAAP
jgi:anti-anti-sigma factor